MDDLELKPICTLKEIDKKTLKLLKKSNLLRPLIKNSIIDNLTKDIKFTKAEINDEIGKFYDNNSINNSLELNKYLDHYGITEEDLRYQILLPNKILELSKQMFQNRIDAHFLKRKESLDKYTYNILRLDNIDLAYELFFQLQEKESDFAKLSFEHSIDSNIFPNGIAGPRSLDGTHPKIVEVLRNSTPGVLIEPIKIERWWLIIKLIERNQATLDLHNTKLMFLELFNMFIEEKINLALREAFIN